MIHLKLREFIFSVLILCPAWVLGQSSSTGSNGFAKPGADTLYVGYTYWWPESGPFVGACGTPYALAFVGIVHSINDTEKIAKGSHQSKQGVIEIAEVLALDGVGKAAYQKQKVFVSDCFEHVDVGVGDMVLVFCYEYEGIVSIPGGNSILKIESLTDPLLTSIRKYIAADQKATAIEDDIRLWEEPGFGAALRQIIACEESGFGR